MWILVVEDDHDLADVLQTGLEEAGHVIDVATDGLEGETEALTNDYDLLVVDWMLPGLDGRTLIKRLREAGSTCPILMLTAFSDLDHKIQGLDVGADDYLTKPFSFEELYARIRALSRRAERVGQGSGDITVGPLRMDPMRHVAELQGQVLDLRAKEYALLELLARRTNAVVSRTVIAERIWGSVVGTSDDVINMTVSTLRQKFQSAARHTNGPPLAIKTIRGVGYTLAAEEA